jgi:hypothetical protein
MPSLCLTLSIKPSASPNQGYRLKEQETAKKINILPLCCLLGLVPYLQPRIHASKVAICIEMKSFVVTTKNKANAATAEMRTPISSACTLLIQAALPTDARHFPSSGCVLKDKPHEVANTGALTSTARCRI